MSLADIKRTWLLKQLGISSSNLTEADLLTQLYASSTAAVLSNAFMPYKVGQWYCPPHSTQSNVLAVANQMRGAPFIAGRQLSVDGLAVEVTTAGSVNSVIRLGLYKDMDDGNIELVVDAGTVDGTVIATPTKTFTPVTLEAGKLYWAVASCQGGPATEPTLKHGAGSPYSFAGSAALVLQNNLAGIQISAITGALPVSVQKSYTTSPFKVGFKVV